MAIDAIAEIIHALGSFISEVILGFDHARVWLCVFVSFIFAGIAYFLLPTLPVWPIILMVGMGGIAGLIWEKAASNKDF